MGCVGPCRAVEWIEEGAQDTGPGRGIQWYALIVEVNRTLRLHDT